MIFDMLLGVDCILWCYFNPKTVFLMYETDLFSVYLLLFSMLSFDLID